MSGLPLRDAVVVIASRETRDATVRGADGLMYRVHVELMGAPSASPPTSASWFDAAPGEAPTHEAAAFFADRRLPLKGSTPESES